MSQVSSVTDTNFELKHRLVGAVILILFGVVVFPMILDAPKPEAEDNNALNDAGDAENKVFVSKIIPISGTTPERRHDSKDTEVPEAASNNVDSAPSPRTAATELDTATEKARPAREAESAEPRPPDDTGAGATPITSAASRPAPVSKVPDQAVERGWIVRIGTFSQPENARRILQRLRDNGFAATAESVDTSRGPATRVWVGPFAQRVEAGRARSRIQQTVGEKGLITAYP